MFWSKLCKSNRNSARNLSFISCNLSHLLYGIWVNIFVMNRYISKSYTRSKNTIYRAGAAVVSTVTNKESTYSWNIQSYSQCRKNLACLNRGREESVGNDDVISTRILFFFAHYRTPALLRTLGFEWQAINFLLRKAIRFFTIWSNHQWSVIR